ncbi:MAG TPA: ABC transporter ATP-binding protein [Candidatus Binatia bacterium]|nr:ABC transporter ATP-binding protein [Candidatus Binatia bacterium]
MTPIIALQSVTKRYGTGAARTTAVDDLSLHIGPGEFVALMGPSGSGKTTVLNLIAGLDTPDSGRIVVDGRDLSQLADHQLADMRLGTIGFVFQSFNLLPALTVERNVAWPLQFAGCKRREVARRTAAALERVGLADHERRRPAELSGGEQQRVAIARAIATRPAILLADEPTGNLDSRTGQKILDLLRELNQEQHVTVVMVTHSTLAAAYGDRTLELHDGRLLHDVRVPRSRTLANVGRES